MALAARAGADDGRLIELSVKDHRFTPAELKAVAGNAILLKIKNLDAAPIEFESMSLEFEVVVKSGEPLTLVVAAVPAVCVCAALPSGSEAELPSITFPLFGLVKLAPVAAFGT